MRLEKVGCHEASHSFRLKHLLINCIKPFVVYSIFFGKKCIYFSFRVRIITLMQGFQNISCFCFFVFNVSWTLIHISNRLRMMRLRQHFLALSDWLLSTSILLWHCWFILTFCIVNFLDFVIFFLDNTILFHQGFLLIITLSEKLFLLSIDELLEVSVLLMKPIWTFCNSYTSSFDRFGFIPLLQLRLTWRCHFTKFYNSCVVKLQPFRTHRIVITSKTWAICFIDNVVCFSSCVDFCLAWVLSCTLGCLLQLLWRFINNLRCCRLILSFLFHRADFNLVSGVCSTFWFKFGFNNIVIFNWFF